MQYMGSKNRIAKHILPIMLDCCKDGQCWVEPFVGGGNMIDKVTGPRLGTDACRYAIEALTMIRDSPGTLPKNNTEFTEADYAYAKKNEYDALSGYAGYAFSYGAKLFGGWPRNRKNDDYVARAYRNAQKQSPKLKGCKFDVVRYANLCPPPKSLIYCDPPYKGATGYKQTFSHGHFWSWCRARVADGHTVFVSEYEAPSDWSCLWQGEIKSSLTIEHGSKVGVEKLFTLDSY